MPWARVVNFANPGSGKSRAMTLRALLPVVTACAGADATAPASMTAAAPRAATTAVFFMCVP